MYLDILLYKITEKYFWMDYPFQYVWSERKLIFSKKMYYIDCFVVLWYCINKFFGFVQLAEEEFAKLIIVRVQEY